MEKKFFNLNLRVLVYQEDGEFFARCLEMDLIGCGDNSEKALEELRSNIEAQITFAVYKNDDGLIAFPAEKTYFERWDGANQAQIHNELFPDKQQSDTALKINGCATIITIEKTAMQKLKKPAQFSPMSQPVFA
jgi:hypothetical protein